MKENNYGYIRHPITREDRMKKREEFADMAKEFLDLLPGENFSGSDASGLERELEQYTHNRYTETEEEKKGEPLELSHEDGQRVPTSEI